MPRKTAEPIAIARKDQTPFILVPPYDCSARTGQPDLLAVDRAVQIAAATVLLEEGVEVREQESITLITHTATLSCFFSGATTESGGA
jgi:hypothetical protein